MDLKNRTTLPVHLSIEEPPILELKAIPSYLQYTFLGDNKNFLVIIAADLGESEVEALTLVLQRFKRAIGWSITDIMGISLGLCTHKVQIYPYCIPSIEHQRRLDPM